MLVIGILLFSLLAINFFSRAIRLLVQIHRLTYSEDAKHSFKCISCEQSYTLSGPETKKRVQGAVRIKKSTPKSQSTFYKFVCPVCGTYSKQEKIFDLNTTKASGNIRVQIDSSQLPLVIDFLLKGVLPIFLVLPLLNLITR
ncbi:MULTISPECIES: hypothetical protein [Enterococcus]|uniref:Uncharacterized protein n=1 Tax=Candidatus Enterococcus murrayae TaxID=2815321 RepID=A0ABS3HLV8_9ENTE|nr:hypothetical protein [Enterococcus sp. MJM16]MBO0453929.1 hypothetical protein [Enterococcus sp. MJM16]